MGGGGWTGKGGREKLNDSGRESASMETKKKNGITVGDGEAERGMGERVKRLTRGIRKRRGY